MDSISLRRTVLTSLLFVSMASCSMFTGRETAGQYVDDATITSKVKEAFVADAHVKASEVNVETMQGVVQLSGFVDSPMSEARAVELAHNVEGVKSVDDNIIVRKKSSY